MTDEQIRLLPNLSTLIDKILHSGVDGARLESQTDNILKVLQRGPEPKAAVAPEVKPPAMPSTPPIATRATPQELITYDYRGYKTSSLTGPMLIVGDEGESKEYQKLLMLQKAAEWKKLLKDASREIKKVPDWLTPYAFKAVALQHLGDTPQAIATLEFVDQRTVGNSDYDQVRHLLNQLRPAKP